MLSWDFCCRFYATEQSLLQMKQPSGWSISWGVSSRHCHQIFLPQHFPACNHSSSFCCSPFCRHRFFFLLLQVQILLLFWYISSLLPSTNSLCWIICGWVHLWMRIAGFKELEVAISYGFDVECAYYLVLRYGFGMCCIRGCKWNGDIVVSLSWTDAAPVLVIKLSYFCGCFPAVFNNYCSLFVLSMFLRWRIPCQIFYTTGWHFFCFVFIRLGIKESVVDRAKDSQGILKAAFIINQAWIALTILFVIH